MYALNALFTLSRVCTKLTSKCAISHLTALSVKLVNARSYLQKRTKRHFIASNVRLASVPLDHVVSVILRFFIHFRVPLVNARNYLQTREKRHFIASNVRLASVPLDHVVSVILRFFIHFRISLWVCAKLPTKTYEKTPYWLQDHLAIRVRKRPYTTDNRSLSSPTTVHAYRVR